MEEFRWFFKTPLALRKKRSKAGRHLRRCLVHLLVKTLFLLLYFCVKMECLLNMSHTQPNAKGNGSDKKFSKLRMPAIISWAQSLLWSLHNMINDHLVKTKHDSINNIYIHWWVQASLTVAIHLITVRTLCAAKTSLFPLTTITTAAELLRHFFFCFRLKFLTPSGHHLCLG